jgi:FkbM family methyltransferase
MLIRTPLEAPAFAVQSLLGLPKRWRHPELTGVFTEHQVMHKLLPRYIRRQSNCIDAGCHLGSFLAQILRLAPEGQHKAFEPMPYKAAWIKKKFPEVDVHCAALSRTAGTAEFHHYKGKSGFDGLQPSNHGTDTSTITVPLEALDEVLPASYRLDFIKIDVEGAEVDLFHGAQRTLARCRPVIVFECVASGLQRFGRTASDVYDFMQDLGYRLHIPGDLLVSADHLSLDAFERSMVYPFRAFNFVALPQNVASSSTQSSPAPAADGLKAASAAC